MNTKQLLNYWRLVILLPTLWIALSIRAAHSLAPNSARLIVLREPKFQLPWSDEQRVFQILEELSAIVLKLYQIDLVIEKNMSGYFQLNSSTIPTAAMVLQNAPQGLMGKINPKYQTPHMGSNAIWTHHEGVGDLMVFHVFMDHIQGWGLSATQFKIPPQWDADAHTIFTLFASEMILQFLAEHQLLKNTWSGLAISTRVWDHKDRRLEIIERLGYTRLIRQVVGEYHRIFSKRYGVFVSSKFAPQLSMLDTSVRSLEHELAERFPRKDNFVSLCAQSF